MTDYGGLGGVSGGRTIDEDDKFEVMIDESFGDQLRTEGRTGDLGKEIWSALANTDWKHTSGDTAGYSFRAAGDLIAAIVGEGDYMDWYCSGPYETVSARVHQAFEKKGWTLVEDTEVSDDQNTI